MGPFIFEYNMNAKNILQESIFSPGENNFLEIKKMHFKRLFDVVFLRFSLSFFTFYLNLQGE